MLLINPSSRDYGGTLSRFTPLMLPMSLGGLAGELLARGHRVEILDEEIARLDGPALDDRVARLPGPPVFGISVLTAQASRAYELAGFLKARYPEGTVIVGGAHVTALPEEALGVDGVDVVVRGEGERTLVRLYEAIRGGEKDFSGIRGISYKRDGEILHTIDAPLIQDLDSLADFPYELFQRLLAESGARRSYDWGFYVSSRGCPYRCSYCSQRAMTGLSYRYKSPGRVVAEVDVLVNRMGAKDIFFIDDNFCFKRSRVKELCEALARSGLGKKCSFSLQTRADNFYPDVVPLLREAGFTSVGFGMETGVDRLAGVIQKGESVQRHVDAVRMARDHGMDVALFLIFGFPTETAEDRLATFRLVSRLDPDHVKFNHFIPYPGTPMCNDVKDTDRFKKVGHWKNFYSALMEMGLLVTAWDPLPYVPEPSSEWELKRDFIRYNMLSWLRPRAVLGYLRRKHGPGWFKLGAHWFIRPGDVLHVLRLFAVALVNLMISFLPSFMMEPLLARRSRHWRTRVAAEKQTLYIPSEWAREPGGRSVA
jgi:anaerobic magnesium-protoporphyrin IX monomethyl ester cyclase